MSTDFSMRLDSGIWVTTRAQCGYGLMPIAS